MRHAVTWLVVAAVGGLAAAAGVDALRGGGEAEADAPRAARAESARARFGDVAAQLRAVGIRGVLTYADEDCRLQALTLPDLERHVAPEGESCRFAVSPGGTLRFGREVGDPQRYLTARCVEGEVEVAVVSGRLLERVPGCAPAWTPDGRLTIVRDGEVVWVSRDALEERVILSRAALLREFRRARWERSSDFAVDELFWLTHTRFAAIVRARTVDESEDLLVVFERGQLLSLPGFAYEELNGLRPSPSGRFVASRIDSASALAVIDRRGEPVDLALRRGHALAWSPDERWVAQATSDGIYFFEAQARSRVFIHLPVVATDLLWR